MLEEPYIPMAYGRLIVILDVLLFLGAVIGGAATASIVSRRASGAEPAASKRMKQFAYGGVGAILLILVSDALAFLGMIPNIALQDGTAYMFLTLGFVLSYQSTRILGNKVRPTQEEALLLLGFSIFALFVNLYYSMTALLGSFLA